MCWNGENTPITLRQSRLIDTVAEMHDAPEFFLLLHWMYPIPLREPKVSRQPVAAGTHAAVPSLPPTTPARKANTEPGTGNNSPTGFEHPARANKSTPTTPTGTPQRETPEPDSQPSIEGTSTTTAARTNTPTQTPTRPITPVQRTPEATSEWSPSSSNIHRNANIAATIITHSHPPDDSADAESR
jgi:hypothetical protein